MVQIETCGRTDLDDFWRLSGILQSKRLRHTPFIAFVSDDQRVVVKVVDSIDALLSLSDDTPVMVQWSGNWSSDFFQFTVADARAAHLAGLEVA